MLELVLQRVFFRFFWAGAKRPHARLFWTSSGCSTDKPGDQPQQEKKDENEKQDLRDTSRGTGHTAEAENGRDDRDHKECQCPAKHERSPFLNPLPTCVISTSFLARARSGNVPIRMQKGHGGTLANYYHAAASRIHAVGET